MGAITKEMLLLTLALLASLASCQLTSPYTVGSESLPNNATFHGAPRHRLRPGASLRQHIDNNAAPGRLLLVDQIAVGAFRTIQAAVNAVPDDNNVRVTIRVAPGIYREKVLIPVTKPNITLQGAGRRKTHIVWDDTAKKLGPRGPLGTKGSASFTVLASRFVARDISFANSAQGPGPDGAPNVQAVAAVIGGDMSAIYNCSFHGFQDTLYDYAGRHYYQDCFIEGTVDFICGGGQSVFKNCELRSRATRLGAFVAQQRLTAEDPSGFIFDNCRLTGVHPEAKNFLGRAWGDYSRTIYVKTAIDNVVYPVGWSDMGNPFRKRTAFFGQYMCFGPGASTRAWEAWTHRLQDQNIRPYLGLRFISGNEWITSLES